MPSEYDNSGALFKNAKKTEDRHPDYKGEATIGGKKFWLSSWLKVSKKTGRKFLSIAFKPSDAPPAESQECLPTEDNNQGVPF